MSDKEIIKIFMENLNKYMNANDVTQADVARYMGVSTSTVAGWCNGLIIPRMDKVQRLAAWFGIDASDFMKDSDSAYYTNAETQKVAQESNPLALPQMCLIH